jgi:hypothetical protein
MSSYQITRVRKSALTTAGHQHIIAVEFGRQVRTVAEVYALIRSGKYDFYTLSPSTGRRAAVHAWTCCGIRTLRSDADAVPDNNLDNLPPC